jgi:exodeoxyribonuclease VII large subunit
MARSPAPERILSITALTRMIQETLGEAFPAVWVKGELTGFRRSERGHLYFTLKDRVAQLECFMWSTAATRLSFEPRDGIEVEGFGSIKVYEARGRYQLLVEELRPGGAGALLLALEKLKAKLQTEGLFDPRRKRPLPAYPARIGLVTSPSGAAVRDMVKVLRARWPGIALILAPVRVQGVGAVEEISAAIARFNRYAGVDLLIVGRGGGSLEDLWAFNEERVVRAIATSRIPVITAIGHEVDVTLADLAADARAATPSNAGEIAVRDRRDVQRRVAALSARLDRSVRIGLDRHRRHLGQIVGKYGFRRQRDVFAMWRQRVDELVERLGQRVRARWERARARFVQARDRYSLREWPRALARLRQRALGNAARLESAMSRVLVQRRTHVTAAVHRLRALSPRLVLERGYCLVRRPDGTLARAAADLRIGDPITLELARGEADARVEAVRPGETDAE